MQNICNVFSSPWLTAMQLYCVATLQNSLSAGCSTLAPGPQVISLCNYKVKVIIQLDVWILPIHILGLVYAKTVDLQW